jgi:hypothetical protein
MKVGMVSRFRQGVSISIRSIAVLFGTLVLAGSGEHAAPGVLPKLEFNGRCYRIPEWNGRLINASAFFPFTERRESTQSLRLQISNAEIREHIPGYELPLMYDGQPLKGALVSLWAPTPAELAQVRRNEALLQKRDFNLWYAEGDWTHRTVKPASVAGLFRVAYFPNAKSWQVVTRMPDMKKRDTHLARDFWISSCRVMEPTTRTTCSLEIELDGVFVESDTPESNLPYRKKIGEFFLKKLDSWKVPCDGGS